MISKKAQASTEFLLILAAALVVLAGVIVVSQQRTVDILEINAQNQARSSAQELGAAAREVYGQGEGARKQVFIELPSSYDPGESFVANHSIKIRAAGSDYVASNEFDMHGSLPSTSGGHWVWVISEANRVRIGIGMLEVDRSGISLIMERDSTETEEFTVTNAFDEVVDVEFTPEWTATEVSMGLDKSAVELDPQETSTVTATFTAGLTALGFYTGNIEISGVSGNFTETLNLPVTVEVVLPDDDPPLTVEPNLWEDNVTAGDVIEQLFTVCTNSQTSVPSVTFEPSPTEPGDWVTNLAPLGPLTEEQCGEKTLRMNIPIGANNGTYTGYVVVSGGTPEAEDYILLNIEVNELAGALPPILFIHINQNPTGNEQRWIDWIDSHSSGAGLDWSYNLTEDDDVVSGTVDLSDYEVVLMGDYSGSALNSDLLTFISGGGHVVFLGRAVDTGPHELGYSSSSGSGITTNSITIIDNSHYITSGFALEEISIATNPDPVYAIDTDFNGGIAHPDDGQGSAGDLYALAVYNNVIVWGVSHHPSSFNDNGDTIATRVIDCALLGCADGAGGGGSFAGEILFITKNENIVSEEESWMDWLDSHSSGEGFDWDYTIAYRGDVVDGLVDPEEYSIVFVAEDVGSSGLGDSTIVILQSYISAGGFLVIVDDACDDVPYDMNVVASKGDDTQTLDVYVDDNSHYISSGLDIGDLDIYTSTTQTWHQEASSFSGSSIIAIQGSGSDIVLGEASNILVWGTTKPYRFLDAADTVTTRLIDYALTESEISG